MTTLTIGQKVIAHNGSCSCGTNETVSFRFWKTCGDKTYYVGNIGATRYIITIK